MLRIRPFRRLWIVLGVASLGDWLGILAVAVFAADQVGGSGAEGFVFGGTIAIRLLPALVLGPVAGVMADRFDRRYTMITIDIIRFALIGSIPLVALASGSPAVNVGWITVSTLLTEAITMVWLPAKDAAVPNLLPRGRLETANQLSLATTFGVTPVAAALMLAALERGLAGIYASTGQAFLNPKDFSLYFLALTRLATAAVVFFGIREIGGRTGRREQATPGMLRGFIDGWAYIGKTKLVRGLVLGILAAFAAGGMVVGIAKFYAGSLGGGESTFYVLFAMIFVGLTIGVTVGPRLIGALSRRRWFGLSIMLAAAGVAMMAFAWHLSVAITFVLLVGIGAGMAYLAGVTLLGSEVEDEVRGRVFGFVNTATRGVLMLAIAVSSTLVGLGQGRVIRLGGLTIGISTPRLLLLASGIVGVLAGVGAFRQMDDKPGVPVLADLWGSLRGRPLALPEAAVRKGLFIVFEGGEGSGKTTQANLLAAAFTAEGHDVVVTYEPGATDLGRRIRSLLLDPGRTGCSGDGAAAGSGAAGPDGHGAASTLAPRAEALLYAADRAHHVATVIRPALARGSVVISDRYIDSSLAYQGVGRLLPVDEVSWLSAWATGGLKPDLVVLLDIDAETGLARVAGRGSADRLEAESRDFHERVRYAFLDLADRDPRHYLVVDATLPRAEIADIVSKRALALLPGHDDETPSPGRPARDGRVPTPPALCEVDPDTGFARSANDNLGQIGKAARRRSRSALSSSDRKR